MQATPRRDPKTFAQRTMAAAIAASAIAAFGFEASAQTTGGGIGANVNSNAGASGNLPTQGTTGTAGGTTTAGVAAPNAPANPAVPGTGPGINNTSSPVLATPRNLQVQIGGGGSRTATGTSRIPGNSIPVNPRLNPRATTGLNGAVIPQPTTAPVNAATSTNTVVPAVPNDTLTGALGRRPAAANLRTGRITDFTNSTITFREGPNTTTMTITPDTVVQMDGQNIPLSAIPANSTVRLERSPTTVNEVKRIVVVPEAAATGAANANLNAAGNTLLAQSGAGTSVNRQSGTGSTGSANRSLRTTGPNDTGSAKGGTSVNTQTGTGSTTAANANQSARNRANIGDFGGGVGATGSNISQRPAAANPAQPRANLGDFGGAAGTTGANISQPRVGDFGGTTVGTQTNTQNQAQNPNQRAATDSSQFLGPVNGGGAAKPSSGDPASITLANRLGMLLNGTAQGLTIGNVTNQSLAARSGLLPGDLVQSVNGTNVATDLDFFHALQTASLNQTPITTTILRNGTPQNVSLVLPNGFFNGINLPAANTIGTAVSGAGNIAVTPDGSIGVNAGGVFVPATEQTQVGATGVAGAAAGATVPNAQSTTQEQTAVQTQTPTRVRPVDPPVAAHRAAVTTEALKIPDVNLGWTLKATKEGVVMSSIVEDGLAARNKFQSGDIIESIDGRPVTAPGAVSYELHRHRAGANVKFGILRNGQRLEEDVTLPEDHKPLLLNRNESFGQANNDAKEQGASGARPIQVKPTEESIRTLEEENRALRQELESLRKK